MWSSTQSASPPFFRVIASPLSPFKMTEERMRIGGPGKEGISSYFIIPRGRIVECNGGRCQKQSAQTATPLSFPPSPSPVTAIKILENNKEGHGAGGRRRGLLHRRHARGVNRWQRGEPTKRTSPLKITAGRFLWRRRMRRSKAANDRRARRTWTGSGSPEFAASLASHRSRDEEGTSKDDGAACHSEAHVWGRKGGSTAAGGLQSHV